MLPRQPAGASGPTIDPYALGRAGLRELLADQPAYRADQIHQWLVRGVDDPTEMTDLPAALRARLAELFPKPPRVLRHSTADSGLTHKVLLECASGEAVESVLMLYPSTAGAAPRATVCISTQAGCAMGCPFCATGQAGFRGQLDLGEVVRQVTVMQRLLSTGRVVADGIGDHVTNVVFMGMGEPLANLDVTVEAVRWLHDPEGFNLSARSITVSTSLHAPNDALRDDLVPVNRQHPLRDLLAACRDYRDATGRRLTFEYVLIDGINAGVEHARELAGLVRPLDAHVNLIPMNPTPAVPWRAPSGNAQHAFLRALQDAGVAATIRRNRGTEIDAACGQLYADYALASGKTLPAARGAAERLLAGSRGTDG
jgi:23S rRNA (adenine2503-C2)-methyltransferase